MRLAKDGSKVWLSILIVVLLVTNVFSQAPQGRSRRAVQNSETNVVKVESPGIQIEYRSRKGATKIEFRRLNDPEQGKVKDANSGSNRDNQGSVKIETKGGFTEIDVCNLCTKIQLPDRASKLFGPYYNTYVLWAVTPHGVTEKIGELLYEDGFGEDTGYVDGATTEPVFGMMVTAEPHFGVLKPSKQILYVSRSQPATTSNAGLAVGDAISYNATIIPDGIDSMLERYQRGEYLPALGETEGLPNKKLRQMRNNIRQALMGLAMARIDLNSAEDNRLLSSDPVISEAAELINPQSATLVKQQMEIELKERLKLPLYEEVRAKQSLEDAEKAFILAEQQAKNLTDKEEKDEKILPVIEKARIATQFSAAAQAYANVASTRIELTRIETQKDILTSLIDDLGAEIRGRRGDLRKLGDDKDKLKGEIERLNKHIKTLEAYAAEYEGYARKLEIENQRLAKDLQQICDELNRVIQQVGEITVQGQDQIIRLKSDILFSTGEYVLGKGQNLTDSQAFDLIAREAALRQERRNTNDPARLNQIDADLQFIRTQKDPRPLMAQLAMLLQVLYKDAQFQFIGYTDTVDGSDYNKWLSEERALEVMRLFYAYRLQTMDVNDALYSSYLQKLQIANKLLNGDFPNYLSESQRAANQKLAKKNKQRDLQDEPDIRASRQQLMDQLADVVVGYGEDPNHLPVNTPDNVAEAQNRRVDVKIRTTGNASLPFCNRGAAVLRQPPPRPTLAPVDPEVIRDITDTELVSVPIIVTRSDNNSYVTDLTKDQIVLEDNGRVQNIEYFDRDSTKTDGSSATNPNTAISIALLADISGSQQYSLEKQRQAAHDFVGRFMKQGDKLAVVSFSHKKTVLQNFTGDQDLISQAIDRIQYQNPIAVNAQVEVQPTDGGTSLYDTVRDVAARLNASENKRRVIILLTDGEDTTSRTSLKQAITAARLAQVNVYVIGIKGQGREGFTNVKEEEMRRLCESTGGRYFLTTLKDNRPEVIAPLNEIAEELRSQYVIYYYPDPATDGLHTIKVRVERRDGRYNVDQRKVDYEIIRVRP